MYPANLCAASIQAGDLRVRLIGALSPSIVMCTCRYWTMHRLRARRRRCRPWRTQGPRSLQGLRLTLEQSRRAQARLPSPAITMLECP